MRSLVKIGLVIPMVALLALGVALADTGKDRTDLNSDLNGEAGSTVRGDADGAEDSARAASDENGTSARGKGELFGDRRSIASRRASTGRAALSGSTNDRWWWNSVADNGDKGSSDSDSSGKSRSSSDEDDEEAASPDGFSDDSSGSSS